MKVKVYRKMNSNEFVYQEDGCEYALDQLGITMKPKGKNGEYTLEQFEFGKEFTEWFFSGDWYEDEIEEYVPNEITKEDIIKEAI